MKTPTRSLMLAVSALALCALAGCATTSGAPPKDANEALAQLAVTGVVVSAVDRVVSRDNASVSEQADRAQKIASIASAVKALGEDKLDTLPELTQAIAPLIERLNLSPVERQQADLLVRALIVVALQRTDASGAVARVSYVLDEVIRATSAYIPREPEPAAQ